MWSKEVITTRELKTISMPGQGPELGGKRLDLFLDDDVCVTSKSIGDVSSIALCLSVGYRHQPGRRQASCPDRGDNPSPTFCFLFPSRFVVLVWVHSSAK